MSLVRKPGGTFILIDSYELDKSDQAELMALTEDGALIEAVLNVHPFHTIHCKFIQDILPHARLIGTRRHHEQAPHLQWDPDVIEDRATQSQFSDIFDFSIPSGVDFISDDDSVHVGSVIVRHRETDIVHVDDTLMFIDLPSLVQKVVPGPKLRFHPKLADGLEKRAGAADDYIAWARGLARDWADTKIICAAHKGIYRLTDETFVEAIDKALEHASDTLDKHRKTYG
ncbi:hypothetical protein [Sphingorhabdus sp. M41]|uniref:hypothetical protein n=1 Tax=Sphingorhabdus sp. M41 TaxID=1806885 RepID=UPI000ACBDCEF|nr:hypothetical protein [Sphingorhabdus sp. M41]